MTGCFRLRKKKITGQNLNQNKVSCKSFVENKSWNNNFMCGQVD